MMVDVSAIKESEWLLVGNSLNWIEVLNMRFC